MKRKVCVVTGTRAEYGLLYWLMKGIQEADDMELQIIATGMHLSPEFGLTYKDIEKDGFKINKKIEMLLSADTPSAITKSTGIGMIGFTDALLELKPDILVLLGDRYEILAAAFSALVANIPIAHIAGGEKTLGSIDESIRHSITKMAWWHFVALDESRNRVLQLGENPNNVYVVGGINVDNIVKTKLLEKKVLEVKLDFRFGENNLMVTFHPETNTKLSSSWQISELLNVLESLENTNFIFSAPNADSGGRQIINIIKNFVHKNKHSAVYFESLGCLLYLSTLQFVDAVVGNSSSGISEAPSFKIGTINIGDRQKGRPKAISVIDCEPNKASIKEAIETLYCDDFQNILTSVVNPYGEGGSTKKIIKILQESPIPKEPKKVFYDL